MGLLTNLKVVDQHGNILRGYYSSKKHSVITGFSFVNDDISADVNDKLGIAICGFDKNYVGQYVSYSSNGIGNQIGINGTYLIQSLSRMGTWRDLENTVTDVSACTITFNASLRNPNISSYPIGTSKVTVKLLNSNIVDELYVDVESWIKY